MASSDNHPLLIPSILLQVTQYLTRSQATVASRVCRVWDKIFSPIIWDTLSIDGDRISTQIPSAESVSENRHHIRKLSIAGQIDARYYSILYTNLTHLTIELDLKSDPELWTPIAGMIEANTHLEELSIKDLCLETPYIFWSSLRYAYNLKRLSITNGAINPEDVPVFWKSCSRLLELEVVDLILRGRPTPLFAPESVLMCQSLKLSVQVQKDSVFKTVQQDDQGAVLRKMPYLTSYDMDGAAVPALIRALKEGSVPQLTILAITSVSGATAVKDAGLANCLNLIPKLQSLTLRGGQLSELAFNALKRHFTTLTCLSVVGNPHVTGPMVQQVLESCPLLEEICASRIDALLILRGRRWQCLNLKRFRVCISVTPSHQHSITILSRMVFVQLARLTRLQELEIGKRSTKTRIQSLDLRLTSGLYQLAGLNDLRVIRYTGTIQECTNEDLEWMVRNWPQVSICS